MKISFLKSGFYLSGFIILLFSLTTCYYNKEEILYPDKPCVTTHITFTGKIDSLFATNTCYTCHASSVAPPDGGGLKLDKYTVARDNINRVYGAVTHQNGFFAMPLGQNETIDPCAINIIQVWRDSGMPEN